MEIQHRRLVRIVKPAIQALGFTWVHLFGHFLDQRELAWDMTWPAGCLLCGWSKFKTSQTSAKPLTGEFLRFVQEPYNFGRLQPWPQTRDIFGGEMPTAQGPFQLSSTKVWIPRLRVSTKNRPQEVSFLFIEGYINHHICGQISLVSTGPRRWAGSLLSCWATSDRGLDTGVDLWRLVGILLQHVNSTSRIQQEETSTKVGKCQPHIMEYNQSTLDMQGQCSRDHPLLIIITFNNNNHFVTGITFNNFKRSPFCHNI